MSSVTIETLTFGYGSTEVLHGIDLQVESGEVLAVLGPSGCGKTTLLRLLAGFERPRGGAIRLADATVAGQGTWVPPERRAVGIVPQEGALYPHLTVAANIGFGLARRDPARADRVAELLELVGLPGLGERFPRELSGGQQQRVALARALAPRPAVVLLDEPFASLDTALRSQVRGAVREALGREKATAVLVTHDQEEALSMADRVAVMEAGRIRQCAAPARIYGEPADAWVAGFVGEANLLEAGARVGDRVDTALGRLRLRDRRASGARILVRPEQIAIDPDGVEARVEATAYLGPTTRLRLRVGEGVPITARVAQSEAIAGDVVRIGVHGPVHLLP